jgi:hypothetical protein
MRSVIISVGVTGHCLDDNTPGAARGSRLYALTGNALVVEIQKGILLYSCHIVRKFLNIDTEHNKTQQSQNVEARRR